MSTVQNQEVNLDCSDDNVMAGLEAKRSDLDKKYIVTAHCQKLDSTATSAGSSGTDTVNNDANNLGTLG